MDFSFWGGPNFSATVLKVFLENNLWPKLIVATPQALAGRRRDLTKSDLQVLAEENNLPILTPAKLKDGEFLSAFKNFQCEFNFLTAYGKIVPSEVLALGEKGFINLHPSLLPKYRGASPIQTALLNREQETGVSLFLMDQGMDDGPILSQGRAIIESGDDYVSLSQKLAVLGAKLALETLPKWLEGICTPNPQNELLATFTRKFAILDGLINWETEEASTILSKIKALQVEPGVYSYFKEADKETLMIKFFDGQMGYLKSLSIKPGAIIKNDQELEIAALDGSIKIMSLQPAGKKIMSGKAFLNGHPKGSFISSNNKNFKG
ncbi:MAG: methionyl-tRNA formyltransferase [Candidatus Parcubacteria bacterium]|nr:methionyl-tRNA formyltransferase [Candidatus Parcubacteria bacterium]